MKILLKKASKRYNRQWIFKEIDYTFEPHQKYAILGNNGSGKSTLLQCIAGFIQLSKGSVNYVQQNRTIEADKLFQYISFASPYLELIEELTLLEHLNLHRQLRPFYKQFTVEQIIEHVQLTEATHKQIQHFSSGMKQRLKLGLAFFTESAVLCLDEPTSNLDSAGIQLYNWLLQHILLNRTLIISSNDPEEYKICTEHIRLSEFK